MKIFSYQLPYKPTVLTFDETIELIDDYKINGNYEAFNKLIVHNSLLVISIVNNEFKSYGDLNDLISAGMIGLIKGIDRFDSTRGVLSKYASYWIKQQIRMYINNNRHIRLPTLAFRGMMHIKKYMAQYTKKYNREPSNAQIYKAMKAKGVGITRNSVSLLKFHGLGAVTSLDQCLTSGRDSNPTTALDIQPDNHVAKPYTELVKCEDTALVRQCLNTLPFKEQIILVERFYNNKTLAHIGRVFGISHERIRQLQERALKRLKRLLKRDFECYERNNYNR